MHCACPYPVAAGAVFAHASKHAQQQACLDKFVAIDSRTQCSHQLPQLIALICLCRNNQPQVHTWRQRFCQLTSCQTAS